MPEKPACPECGTTLVCPDCTAERDPRPTADALYARCQVRSPFGRWETVERVERVRHGTTVRVFTKEAGPDFSWAYHSWEKIDMVHPLPGTDGTPAPEVRVVETAGNTGYMYAIAIGQGRTYGLIPAASAVLVESRPAGRGKGWWVSTPNTTDTGDPVTIEGLTKAQARSKVRELARAYAKKLKVKVNIQQARDW